MSCPAISDPGFWGEIFCGEGGLLDLGVGRRGRWRWREDNALIEKS